MKKLIYALLFLSALMSYCFAQVRITGDNFPIGGMDINSLFSDNNTIRDSMKFIGFNTYYMSDDYGSKFSIAGSLYSWMRMYAGATNYNSFQLVGYSGSKDNFPGTERRYFLATTPAQTGTSNYSVNADYERVDLFNNLAGNGVWKTIKGPTPFPTNRAACPSEWKIFPFDHNNNLYTNDMLNLELGSIHTDKEYNVDPWWSNNLAVFHDGDNTNLIIDFIFRFDGTGPESLYVITATVFDDASPPQPVGTPITVTLTKTLYAANKDFSTHANSNKDISHPEKIDYNNPITLFQFPDVSTKTNSYAVVRIGSLNIGLRNNTTDNPERHKVVLTMKRYVDPLNSTNNNTIAPIYVRGFRLRTQRADDILNGSLNSQIKTKIFDKWNADLLSITSNNGNTLAADRVPTITIGGVSTFESYRVIAYIDMLWHNYYSLSLAKKNTIEFLAENLPSRFSFAQYRDIYEDETGTPPPLGPTMDVMPESNFKSVLLAKDLKPMISNLERYIEF